MQYQYCFDIVLILFFAQMLTLMTYYIVVKVSKPHHQWFLINIRIIIEFAY